MKVIKKEVWAPLHTEYLTKEEGTLVIPMMKTFLEKLKPDNSFDKYKVRVLMRGNLQHEMGESQGPVCQIESLKTIMSITTAEK